VVPDSFGGGECMEKPKKNEKTNYFEVMEELGKKHGVKVTDMSKRGIRAVGFLGGVGRKDQRPDKPNSPANRRRKVVRTPGCVQRLFSSDN
jgi:hypothetical protein